MPYENEHACRLRNPGDFAKGSFRRISRKHEGKSYGVIVGKIKGQDATTDQAYRYPKKAWGADEARKHCKEHGGTFEPAADAKSQEPEAERRAIAFECGEIRIAEEGEPKLIGYAAKYGRQADLGWFKEKIKTGAFDEALKTSDVRALKNHDANLLLGRESSGTLRLESNTIGLHFEIDMPDTTTGRDTIEEVRRGDLAGCSFAFTVAEDVWKHTEGEPSERTIIRIDRLFDVGPVTYPAYEDTTVVARSVEAMRQSHQEKETEPAPPIQPTISDERRRGIERGYRKAQRIIDRCQATDVAGQSRADVPGVT
jgi:HK97 family phage prohead protease